MEITEKNKKTLYKRIPIEAPRVCSTDLLSLFDEFEKHHLRKGGSEITIRGVKNSLNCVYNHLNIKTIEACNDSILLEDALFERKEKKHWAAGTFNTHRKNINTYFLWLHRRGYIDENNIFKVVKCKEIPKEQLVLKKEQVPVLMGQIFTRRQTELERWRTALFVGIMLLTGARPCELQDMKVIDIRPLGDTYEIIVHGRKQKGRDRPYRMPSGLRDIYNMYMRVRKRCGRNEEFLFVSQSKRTGFGYKGISRIFRKLSKECGFRVTAYSIRRFVATNLFLNEEPMINIQHHMGHTRASTTMRYFEHSCAITDSSTKKMAKCLKDYAKPYL